MGKDNSLLGCEFTSSSDRERAMMAPLLAEVDVTRKLSVMNTKERHVANLRMSSTLQELVEIELKVVIILSWEPIEIMTFGCSRGVLWENAREIVQLRLTAFM